MFDASFADDPAPELRALLASGRFRDVLERHARLSATLANARADVALVAATAATRLGELDRAGLLADAALDRFHSRGDLDGETRSLNLLGAIDFERGALDPAERRFAAALARAERLGDSLLAARAANNLASVSHLRGEPERALGLYRSALLAYERIGDRRGTAETWHNVGITFRLMQAWDQADDAAAEAVRHAEQAGEPTLVALALTGRAELELDRGGLDLAARALARARELAADAGDEIGAAEARRLEGVLLLREGDPAAAIIAAEEALAVARRHGSALLEAESAAVAALACRAAGRDLAADTYRKVALAGYHALGAVAFEARLAREWAAGPRS